VEYSHSFERGVLTEEQTLQLGDFIFSGQAPLEMKKKALTLLAHLGTITAFRLIEMYHKKPDKELKQWSALALQECKMFLEDSLTNEMTGFISSGLGGLYNKMRF